MNAPCEIKSTPSGARERILQAAFEEMYEHGFQGLRIDAVLKKTQLAKGALYHYFPTKLVLGYTVVDEVIMEYFKYNWNELLSASNDPLQALKDFFQKKFNDCQCKENFNGCPLGNLVQEMSTLDAGFHQRLLAVVTNLVTIVATALAEGQARGIVRKDIEPQKISMFLFSSYQGIMAASKCMQSIELTGNLFTSLSDYIESLRAS